MIAAEDEGDRLSSEELVEQLILLYIAGHETTVNLIGNGTLALLRNRDQLELLRDDPSVDATMADELLRYDSPVQMSRRITLADYEIDGHKIEAGSLLDDVPRVGEPRSAKWGDTADSLDLRRTDAHQHMSFGGGFHSCLGAHLAAARRDRGDQPPRPTLPRHRARDRHARVERAHRPARPALASGTHRVTPTTCFGDGRRAIASSSDAETWRFRRRCGGRSCRRGGQSWSAA